MARFKEESYQAQSHWSPDHGAHGEAPYASQVKTGSVGPERNRLHLRTAALFTMILKRDLAKDPPPAQYLDSMGCTS